MRTTIFYASEEQEQLFAATDSNAASWEVLEQIAEELLGLCGYPPIFWEEHYTNPNEGVWESQGISGNQEVRSMAFVDRFQKPLISVTVFEEDDDTDETMSVEA